jgi:hypothetical protein
MPLLLFCQIILYLRLKVIEQEYMFVYNGDIAN